MKLEELNEKLGKKAAVAGLLVLAGAATYAYKKYTASQEEDVEYEEEVETEEDEESDS